MCRTNTQTYHAHQNSFLKGFHSWNMISNRSTEWFGLEGTLKISLFQPPYHWLGCFSVPVSPFTSLWDTTTLSLPPFHGDHGARNLHNHRTNIKMWCCLCSSIQPIQNRDKIQIIWFLLAKCTWRWTSWCYKSVAGTGSWRMPPKKQPSKALNKLKLQWKCR